MAYDLQAARGKFASKKLPVAKVRAWIENNFPDNKPRKDVEYRVNNPFNGDTGRHMNINVENLGVHDWRGDDWAGPVNPKTGKRNCSFIKLVRLYKKCSYAEAIRDVLGTTEDIKQFLRPESRTDEKSVRTIAVALPDGTERISDNQNDKQASIIIKWLCSRGYNITSIDKNDLYFLALDCYWPYYEFDELVYWQSRNCVNKTFRFPDLKVHDKSGTLIGETVGGKGDYLYGFDECENLSYVIITESIFGQHTLGQQTLASGGASLTDKQAKKLRIIGPKKGIILSPDNDKAGIDSIIANHMLLKDLGYPMFYSVPPKIKFVKNGEAAYTKDWNEFVKELKMSTQEVRQLHDSRIKPLNTSNMISLRKS